MIVIDSADVRLIHAAEKFQVRSARRHSWWRIDDNSLQSKHASVPMHDEHSAGAPIQFSADHPIWSLAVFLVATVLITVTAVCLYRNRPAVPIALLFIATVIGLFTWPLLAIVSALILSGLIGSTRPRAKSSTTDTRKHHDTSPAQLPGPQ